MKSICLERGRETERKREKVSVGMYNMKQILYGGTGMGMGYEGARQANRDQTINDLKNLVLIMRTMGKH